MPSPGDLAILAIVLALLVLLVSYPLRHVYRLFTGRMNAGMDEEYGERPCKECGYHLRASGDRCPECGTIQEPHHDYLKSLLTDWPDVALEPRQPSPSESLRMLHSTTNSIEANALIDQLRARGVLAIPEEGVIAGDYARGGQPIFYRVMVYEDDWDLACSYFNRIRGQKDAGTLPKPSTIQRTLP